ncbi:helix-turn-helix domain-containing protein [Ornithinicoccus halotolerans]|uniref:helix-turn-helix domain-containing protein n=1 Tax=Ornithinicoccus halotolerans TaxID=1748220 RepID=UPI001297AE0B|nr:helix-turn-helix domain-containing protein [Ornithinicoccus halotolerans]
MTPRFLTLTDVAETLNVSLTQVKLLVRSGDLPAIKVGGRGAWRVEASELEAYIERLYAQTREAIERQQAGGQPVTPGPGSGEEDTADGRQDDRRP